MASRSHAFAAAPSHLLRRDESVSHNAHVRSEYVLRFNRMYADRVTQSDEPAKAGTLRWTTFRTAWLIGPFQMRLLQHYGLGCRHRVARTRSDWVYWWVAISGVHLSFQNAA